ncbi:MAG: zinc ribbon domain-containing protein [Bacillota bacterium]
MISMVFGAALIIVAALAALSGEPATKTNTGVLGMAFAMVLGVIMVAQGADAVKKKASTRSAPIPSAVVPPAAAVAAKCPHCGKAVSEEYVACPHCGTALKLKCPSCGKELKPEFVVCPFCGTKVTKV